MTRKRNIGLGALVALVATVALAAGFDRFRDNVKIGQGGTTTKTVEFDAGNGASNAVISADSSNNVTLAGNSAGLTNGKAFRFYEATGGGTDYVAMKAPAAVAAPITITLPGTLPGADGAVRTATTLGVESYVSVLPIANGGTAGATKAAAFDSLSPMTTSGDIIVGGTSGTGTRSACATANTVLRGGTPAACGALVNADIPTTLTGKTLSGNTATNLVSGSGTLTLNTSGTITVPNATQTLATLAGTESLSNKTFTSNIIYAAPTNSTQFQIKADSSDGADQGTLYLGSGGNSQTSRGAWIELVGNEASTASGQVYISGGDASVASGSNNAIVFGGSATTGSGVSTTSASATGAGAWTFFKGVTISGTGGNTPHACLRRSNNSTNNSSQSVSCSAGEIVTGGGCLNAGTPALVSSYPASTIDSWQCNWNANSGAGVAITAYAVCCAL